MSDTMTVVASPRKVAPGSVAARLIAQARAETGSAQTAFGHLPRAEQKDALAPAFAAFDRVRAEKLRLYDDVEPALARLRADHIPVVGYSAATSVNIAKRIKMLGLAGRLDRVYASPYTGQPYPGRRIRDDNDHSIIELPKPKPDPDAVSAAPCRAAPGEDRRRQGGPR